MPQFIRPPLVQTRQPRLPHPEPVDRPIFDRCVAAARQGRGDAAFAAAWETGRAMQLDQALAEARSDSSATRPLQTTESLLTAREHEVARLIARGMSNPQIAEQLVVSPRTADRDVSN